MRFFSRRKRKVQSPPGDQPPSARMSPILSTNFEIEEEGRQPEPPGAQMGSGPILSTNFEIEEEGRQPQPPGAQTRSGPILSTNFEIEEEGRQPQPLGAQMRSGSILRTNFEIEEEGRQPQPPGAQMRSGPILSTNFEGKQPQPPGAQISYFLHIQDLLVDFYATEHLRKKDADKDEEEEEEEEEGVQRDSDNEEEEEEGVQRDSDDEGEEEEEGVQRDSDDEEEEEEGDSSEYATCSSTQSDEDNEVGKRKRKRKASKTDPFNVAPNKHTGETFLATNPFLSEAEGCFPFYCRFDETLQMNPEALSIIMGSCLEDYAKLARTFPDAITELENRIKHAILVTDIKKFTKPSDERPPGKKRRVDPEVEAEDMKVDKDEDHPPGTGSSNESMHNDHEKAEGNKYRTDFRISVKDLRALTRRSRVLLKRQPWRLAIIIEAKGKRDLAAVYQGIASSQHQLIENFKNGHTDPVYILVLTPLEWTYVMLDVAGLLEVKNKKITKESYKEYLKTARLHYSRLLKKKISSSSPLLQSYETLQKQLSERIRVSNAYRDGWYMVGTLYIPYQSGEWLSLPKCDRVLGSVSHDVKILYEGLARCIIGERVLDWSKEDARAAAKVRDRVEAEFARYSGVQADPQLAPAYRFVEGLPQEIREELFANMRRQGLYDHWDA